MKRLYSFLSFWLFATIVSAVPAQRTTCYVTLADGSKVFACISGDEKGLRFASFDGRELVRLDNGRFSYADFAHDDIVPASRSPWRVGEREKAPLPSIGEVNIPVVLVQFADRSFAETDPVKLADNFYLYFNGENYTAHGSVSSVRDYFVHESDAHFLPHFTILGPVTLDKGYAYYGRNEGRTVDVNYSDFRNEALEKLTERQSDFNWSMFDNGGNGSVDMVFFVFAGTGENVTYDPDEIWPKESTTSTNIGGVTFESSAVCSEAYPSKGHYDASGKLVVEATKLSGIGVMLHELMHALGLPDFYDTSNGSTPVYGMDLFSIMDYGEYNNNGYSPSGLTAYERDFLEWRPMVEITEAGTYMLRAQGTAQGFGYKVVNDLNPDEYYILEYRAATGHDVKLAQYAHGLTVTHVDYAHTAWINNRVNTNPSHQRMTLLPAAGEGIGIGWLTSNDPKSKWRDDLGFVPFPGKGEVDSLTNNNLVYPSVVYKGGFMSKPIFNIKEDEENMILTFDYLRPSDENGIASVHSSHPETQWYTLAGANIASRPKRPGIYIHDNKKVIIKR